MTPNFCDSSYLYFIDMSYYERVNQYRIDIIKSLGLWLISPFGVMVFMLIFDSGKLSEEISLEKCFATLLFLVLGLKCLNKAYEINQELDEEEKNA